jgi:DNA-binding NarL/FixJ family response regulator
LTPSANLGEDDAGGPREARGGIRALIVGKSRPYCDRLAEALRQQDNIQLLGVAEDGQSALARARSLRPDVIVVDTAIFRPLRAVRALVRELPQAGILALGVPEIEERVIACIEAGAIGCLPPEASLEEVCAGVASVSRGEAPCSPRMTAAVFERVRELGVRRAEALDARLTPREREIAALIDEGLSNRTIAERLSLETATVKNHVHNILEKLGVSSRGEAAAALRSGTRGRHDLTGAIVPFLCDALGQPVGAFLASLCA